MLQDTQPPASNTNPGASNAEDFQPPTGNPQATGSNTSSSGLQNSTIQQLLQNEQTNTRIVVPVNPAPASPTVTEAKNDWWTVFAISLLIFVVLCGIYLMWKRKRQPPITVPVEAAPTPSKTIKSTPKKKKTKTTRRKRRAKK